ncbi:MAG: hypothetical protein ACRC62_30070 [Microcoleus sp.]
MFYVDRPVIKRFHIAANNAIAWAISFNNTKPAGKIWQVWYYKFVKPFL